HITVKPSYGLSDAEIARMLLESSQHAQDDMQARTLREQQVEANQLLEAVQNALEQDGAALLDEAGQARIRSSMDGLRAVLQTSDPPAIKRAITQLNDATVAFAQARMDKSVSRALGGRKLTDLEV
ncbi:MAG: Hsp70 family protein, partial [Nitrosomonadales bacterium]|nr:Hsp70 family protein [Nitrosomonadales bacterium]